VIAQLIPNNATAFNARSDECVLGFGIPLSEEAFRQQAQNPKGGDFIRSQRLSWEKYRYLFVDSCHEVLKRLRRWNVRIVEELTLAALTEVFLRPPLVTILFAHWSETEGSVELADGLASPEQVVQLVPNGFTNLIDLCVCHPRQLVDLLKQKCPDCLVKKTDTKASPLYWIHLYEATFKILNTRPDYFQALADAFKLMAGCSMTHETTY
jgi:hypothetical protein